MGLNKKCPGSGDESRVKKPALATSFLYGKIHSKAEHFVPPYPIIKGGSALQGA